MYLCINGLLSDTAAVTSGVPQGSHLGPLLFILFLNDIYNYISYSKFLLYADDLKIYSSISCNDDHIKLQSDLNQVSNYFARNRLKLNVSKCHLVRFTRNTVNIFHSSYSINGSPLEMSSEMPDLGVIYDSEMNFSPPISNMVNRAYRMLGFVQRICKDFSHISTYILLYKSLIRCHVEYCIPILDPHYINQVNAVERIQKKKKK